MLDPMDAKARLLQVVLEDAPTDEFESAIKDYLQVIDGLARSEAELATKELDQLLELRGLLDRNRRRTRELRALFETAGDLSSVRDVEGVLQAIVRRGRQLLGTDVAYLMLVDEDRDDTFMRVTEGTVSPHFIEIRLPLGIGLGGQVAKTMTPHWTSDYLGDSRYFHAIDDIVAEEELVAILGVPLKIGRRLLGVLFAADREPREFTQDEISLLASLGDHAAIAIDNASLFQETRSAVDALRAANKTIEESNRRLEVAVDLHERLMAVVLKGGSFQEVADALVGVLGGSLLIRLEQRSIAGKPVIAGSIDAAAWRTALEEVDEKPARTPINVSGSCSALVTPVVAGADVYGRMVYVSESIAEVDIRSLERAGTIVALMVANERVRDEADNRVRGEILAELLIPGRRQDREVIARRARLLGVDLDTPLVVLAVEPASGVVTRQLQDACTSVAREAGGLASVHAEGMVVVLPETGSASLARDLAARLKGVRNDIAVGSSGPVTDLGVVVRHADRARRVGKLLLGLGRYGEGASAEDLGIYGLLLSDLGQEHVNEFIETRIGRVIAYDSERGTSLLATLEAYFATEGNVPATAAALFIHTNTMYQRLERLDRILGVDWRVGERALDIRLALRFQRLLRGVRM